MSNFVTILNVVLVLGILWMGAAAFYCAPRGLWTNKICTEAIHYTVHLRTEYLFPTLLYWMVPGSLAVLFGCVSGGLFLILQLCGYCFNKAYKRHLQGD